MMIYMAHLPHGDGLRIALLGSAGYHLITPRFNGHGDVK